MRNKFKFEKDKDISTKHVSFEELENYSIRNVLRDIYDKFLRKPFYYLRYKDLFKNQNYKIDLVLPGKGFSHKSRRNRLNAMKKIKGKKILNIGCGNAFDYHYWFKFKPEKIVGIDVLNYKKSWEKVSNYIKKKNIETVIEFYKSDFVDFQYNEKFDFIVSDAVFEHCKDLRSVVKNCFKILKDDGIMYASYGGPMWFTYAGDHFSGRDNVKNGYNHLLLEKNDYKKYVDNNIGTFDFELNQGGGGGILVKSNLFSKLTANQYFEIFHENNFYSKSTTVEYCPIGRDLMNNDISLRNKLLNKYKNIHLENFYLKTHIVYLEKK